MRVTHLITCTRAMAFHTCNSAHFQMYYNQNIPSRIFNPLITTIFVIRGVMTGSKAGMCAFAHRNWGGEMWSRTMTSCSAIVRLCFRLNCVFSRTPYLIPMLFSHNMLWERRSLGSFPCLEPTDLLGRGRIHELWVIRKWHVAHNTWLKVLKDPR